MQSRRIPYPPSNLLGIGVSLRLRLLGMTVGKGIQLEKEVPQPHDFDEFGLTNTKPCCISVSW